MSAEEITVSTPKGTTGNTVKQTILTNIEAPRLKGISTKDFIAFKRDRELYEKQVNEKNKDPNNKIPLTSVLASIDKRFLKTFIAAQWISVDSIDKITDALVTNCIESRTSREIDVGNLHQINEAVKHVSMNMSITDADDRIWTMHSDYMAALEDAGFGQLPDTKPSVAIKHFFEKLRPNPLKQEIQNYIEFNKAEKIDQKDFNGFVRKVAEEARDLDRAHYRKLFLRNSHRNGNRDEPEKKRETEKQNDGKLVGKRRTDGQRTQAPPKPPGKHGPGNTDDESKKRKRQPICLNPECKEKGIRHWVDDCTKIGDEEKQRLKAERIRKKQKTDHPSNANQVGQVATEDLESHSALFSASMAKGAVECLILTDQGADVNLMPKTLFEELNRAGGITKTTILVPPRTMTGIGEPANITCKKRIVADVQLRIRHGSALLVRNVSWYVSEQEFKNAIIGRPLLEQLGCDNKTILEAAKDQHDGTIDAAEMPQEGTRNTDDRIQALLAEAIFHSAGGIEEDGLGDDDIYIDMGDDPEEHIVAELEKRVDDARKKGLSKEGAQRLRDILFKRKSVFD